MAILLFSGKERAVVRHEKAPFFLEDVFFNKQGKIEFYIFQSREEGLKNQKIQFETIFLDSKIITPRKELTADGAAKKNGLTIKKNLLKAEVFTEGGLYFGRVSDIEIETEINRVENILVIRHFWEKYFHSPLYINILQVVEFRKNRVIIKDAFIKEMEAYNQQLAAKNS